ncbi:phd finger containing protein phf1 [Diplodia corticola]|uniref:Phd finger containing protein phf1 n=1 Tax=Diplodia corticola TaxID=236234 RepID=A0A1J9RGU0_9PEZI|nr:phd finger containing protein phf1 [Diplodia corticola]OJD39808.1 phd finger containing protein phf1 [Diplodia corticola]
MSLEPPPGAPAPANAPAHPNNGQTASASSRPWPAATSPASSTTLHSLKPTAVPSATSTAASSASPGGLPRIPSGFSASTEEILRRVSANASAHVGTPGYEAAREQVLKSMVTSDKIPTPPPMAATKRGARGASKTALASSSTPRPESAAGAGESSATPASVASATSARGRGSGRGRGRGGSRGGKRKRADTPDSEDDSDISSSYTPLPTKTKSGRNVTKPTQFMPVLPSPSTATRKKRPNRRPTEMSVCRVCQRGHSPISNMIVFCDGCNSGYHQYCHQPEIDREVVQVTEKEWFCGACVALRRKQDEAIPNVNELVSGQSLTREEKRAYFSTLSTAKLTELLLHATDIYHDLPVFAPNSRSLAGATGAAARQFGATMTNHAMTDSAAIQTNHSAALNNANFATSHNQTQTINPATTTSVPPPSALAISSTSSITPAATTLNQTHSPSTLLDPEPEDAGVDEADDPYGDGDGYDSDPPAHYPKPGHGLARTLRPESEDLQWLVDDNLEVFSHVYTNDGQSGLNGFGPDGAIDLAGAEAAAAP